MLDSEAANVADILDTRAALDNFGTLWDELFPAEQARIIQLIIEQITVYPNKIIIKFRPPGMISVLHELLPDLNIDPSVSPEIHEPMEMTIPIDFKKSKNRKIITTPNGQDLTQSVAPQHDTSLVKAIVRAYKWEDMLEEGAAKSITDIARKENMDRGYVSSVMRLTALAPDIITAILNGRQPQALQLSAVIRTSLPYCWEEQREMLGFKAA